MPRRCRKKSRFVSNGTATPGLRTAARLRTPKRAISSHEKTVQGPPVRLFARSGLRRRETISSARKFLLEKGRADLRQAPACDRCNNEKAKLESYLMTVLPFGGRHIDTVENLASMVKPCVTSSSIVFRLHARGSCTAALSIGSGCGTSQRPGLRSTGPSYRPIVPCSRSIAMLPRRLLLSLQRYASWRAKRLIMRCWTQILRKEYGGSEAHGAAAAAWELADHGTGISAAARPRH